MQNKVETIEIAPGFSISRVLTGLWQIADMERNGKTLDLKAAAAAAAPYVEAGFTTFDMADHYGSAEEIAGLFLQEYGLRVQLFTKWVPKPGPVTREDVRTAVQRSLDRMQAAQLDLLQFHAWNYADPIWLDSLFWLQELKQAGLIRHLGVTNVDTAHLRVIVNSGIDIVSNQVCFSLLDQRARQDMTELCQEHGIKLLAFGTIAGGFLTEHWLDKPEPRIEDLATWSQMKYKRFIDAAGGWQVFQDLLHTVANIARKLGVSVANIACRYILEEPAVGGIIIGARLGKSEHIQNNLRLFQFALDEESRSRIGEALTKLKAIPGDCGDEYRKPPFLTASGDLSHHLESLPPPYEPRTLADGRNVVLCGSPWEDLLSPSRAVRQGDHIWISGITADHGDRIIGGKDPIAQLHFTLDKVEGALTSLGGRLTDVIRIQVGISNLGDKGPVTAALEKRYAGLSSTNSIAQALLEKEEYMVEVRAEAIVKEGAK